MDGVMKILERGNTHEDWSKDVRCGDCDSRLRVTIEDLKRERGGDMRESWDYVTVKCPVCYRVFDAGSTKELPALVQRRLYKGD